MDDQHAAEAKERWGDTGAYRISAERKATYTAEQWQEAKAEADEIARAFAEALQSGWDGTDVAERHRRHIDQWYYPCSPEAHTQLGEMYVSDPRFTAYWERFGEGLAEFVRQAIRLNAEPS